MGPLGIVEAEILDDKEAEKEKIACWERARPALVDLLESSSAADMDVHNCQVHKDQASCEAMDRDNARFTAAVDRFIMKLAECDSPRCR